LEKKLFTGQYVCAVDDRGRMKIPSALINDVGARTFERMRLGKSHFPCLTYHTDSNWMNECDQFYLKLSSRVPSEAAIRRRFFSAVPLGTDLQQRILLPKVFMEYANITDEAVLVGCGHYCEIWSASQLQQEEDRLTKEFNEGDIIREAEFRIMHTPERTDKI
jgi:MraZ protein